ncbi:EndoU domain-containing protein [Roseospira navarrensis]|uniref:Bacterial EndoU nuclease domain-containing protein n=1 Tax=Roseospira navarrensis TaxID=140058 RepID=A0A7X1ZCA6_9PROT|nr:EndoU domain-containing protein [Roseospira navarrensis]MQX35930.1 hypothetical protein [Roseospira navarrensis]
MPPLHRVPFARAARMAALPAVLALGVALAGPFSASARAAVAIEGTFTARAECPGYQSFNAGTNPGMVVLTPGTVYGAFEINRPDGAWIRLRVPGAEPLERWVARECGRLQLYDRGPETSDTTAPVDPGADPASGDLQVTPLPAPGETADLDATPEAAPAARPGDPPPDLLTTLTTGTLISRSSTAYPWYFDRIDRGADDPTPPPPMLGEVDADVLELCGDWGAPVARGAFEGFLEARPGLRASLLATLQTDDVTKLVDAWFAEGGFRHIFCGEPDQRDGSRWKLGGMHYMGRYAQAQLNGWAGRLEGGCAIEETAPPIYTAGTQFRAPDGSTGIKCINGYALGLTASDILFEVTKAYRDSRTTLSSGTGACRARILDNGNAYEAVFVVRSDAIVTFYPDATPDESLRYCAE